VRDIAHGALMQAGGLWMHVRETRAPDPIRRVVLIRPDHLGDVLLLSPALARLRAALPDLAVTLMVDPLSCPVAQNGPEGVTVEASTFPGITRGPKPHPMRPYVDLWFTARHLRAGNYDAALILRDDHWWGGGAAAMGHIPLVFGFDHPATRPALTERLPWTPRAHAARTNLVMVEALIARVTGKPPRSLPANDRDLMRQHPLVFRVPDAARQRAAALLDGWGMDTPLVAVNPGAGAPVKRWLPERWAHVADTLAVRYGAAIVLTGAPGEEELTAAVARAMARPALDLVGKTDIPTLVALYERCALVIGPDSGSLHFAVAARAPSIHLYGPADVRQFGPWGDPERHVAITASTIDIPCLGCGDLSLARPPAPPCMTILEAADVLAVADRLLSGGVRS
jgi:heptosyltransferase-2/heptosyltransferase-3